MRRLAPCCPNTEDALLLEKLGDLALPIDGVGLIILDFPKFTDGRAYTQARLLRERLGYIPEMRPSGAVFHRPVAVPAALRLRLLR